MLLGLDLRLFDGLEQLRLSRRHGQLELIANANLRSCRFALHQLRRHHEDVSVFGAVRPNIPLFAEGFDVGTQELAQLIGVYFVLDGFMSLVDEGLNFIGFGGRIWF